MNVFILYSSFKYIGSDITLILLSRLSLNANKVILQEQTNLNTKFISAIKKYDSEVAEFLYPNVNIKAEMINEFPFKETTEAKFKSMMPILTLLTKDNIDTCILNKSYHQMLCLHGLIDIIKLLVANGMQIQPDGKLEKFSVLCKHFELAKYLFEKGTHKNISLTDVYEDYEMTKFLLDRNVKTNISFALTLACQNNDYDVAKLLLEHGADTDSRNDEYGLRCAMKNENNKLINLLRRYGSSIRKANYFNENYGYDKYHLYAHFDGDDDNIIYNFPRIPKLHQD